VFNSEFNLSFHQPMKDTCHKCDRFKILLDVSPNREVEVQRELHLRKAEKVRAKLSSAKESNSNAHMRVGNWHLPVDVCTQQRTKRSESYHSFLRFLQWTESQLQNCNPHEPLCKQPSSGIMHSALHAIWSLVFTK